MTVRERAEEYIRQLTVGSEIVEDTDGPVVAEFRHLLAPLLFKRGLYLERTARGQVVTDRPPWFNAAGELAQRHQPITCATCKRSFFECEHGVGTGVVTGSVVEPVFPFHRAVGRALA
jgi:hypothetical protein